MKLFAAVMPLFVVGISMVHFHPERPGFSEELLKMRKHFITVLHAQNRKDLLEYLETLFLSISQKKNSEYLSLVIHEIFVVYHVYFHIPENLAQPVTEF